ncbi:MAG: alanine racemase [Salinibacterium sp.]|nr:alanine racemase [Salinibacterium sp.]
MMREALIDLGAISHNVEVLRGIAGVDAMVIVKANGYGHGAVESARAALAGGATWLGVADLDEARALRVAGVDAPLLAWLHDPVADFASAVEAGIDVGVSSAAQLEALAALPGRAEVQLKVDTGLGRNGATLESWPSLVADAAAHERAGRLHVRGIWSHLSNTGADEDAAQVQIFAEALAAAHAAGLDPELVHLAATAGALHVPASRFGMVRLGIGAYGLSPDAAPVAQLRPAMELAASVVSTKRVPAGHGVSYGYDHVTSDETTLALVPLGYADGIPRHASGRAQVTINGVRHRVTGRIAMDQFVVDVGDHAVAVGDRVVLFGDDRSGVPSAADWADWADTINYEVVTRIGNRVKREYRL